MATTSAGKNPVSLSSLPVSLSNFCCRQITNIKNRSCGPVSGVVYKRRHIVAACFKTIRPSKPTSDTENLAPICGACKRHACLLEGTGGEPLEGRNG